MTLSELPIDAWRTDERWQRAGQPAEGARSGPRKYRGNFPNAGPTSVVRTLDLFEFLYGFREGLERNANAIAHGWDNQQVQGRLTLEEIHGAGACAEFAVSLVLGRPWTGYGRRTPGGVDLHLADGALVDVKLTTYRNRPWIRTFPKEDPGTIIVCVAWDKWRPREFEVVGWEYVYVIREAGFWRGFKGGRGGGSHYLASWKTRDIIELTEAARV